MEGKTVMNLASLLQDSIQKKAPLAGKILHAHILRFCLFPNTFLCNRLIAFYAKCDDVTAAYQVFDKMPRKDAVSWNSVISSLVRSGYMQKALTVYDTMISEGFLPTHFTFPSIFSACGQLLDNERGRRCHGLAVKIGLDEDLVVGNALLCFYTKCESIKDALRVFWNMPDTSEVTFTTMMAGLAKTGWFLEARDMFKMMCMKGIRIDSVSLSSLLSVLGGRVSDECEFYDDPSDGFLSNAPGEQIHGIAIKLGFERDLHLNNSLLDMYAKNGDMDSAELLFATLPEINTVSWNIMIAGYGQKNQRDKALEYLQGMRRCGFEPNEVTCINMLAACVKSGDIETGRRMFDRISAPTVTSWNALLSAYSHNENHKEVIKIFKEMQFKFVQPDRTTLAVTLSSCAGMGLLDAGKQVHAAALKYAFHTNKYVASGLISMYAKCGKKEMAECIFYNIPEVDIVCWNSMIAGFSHNSLEKEAFLLFSQMRQNGILPSQFSYASILSACTKLYSPFQGRQVHALAAKVGYQNDVFVGSALINMYCNWGDVDEAIKFFNMMSAKSTVTWNEIIHGHAQNGRAREAVHLYKCMIESGEKPDSITFVSVLSACSHSGLVNLGLEIFNSMQRVHGLEPQLDHYTCVIDSLGRANRFLEAEMLIEKMPYKDDPIIWEVLLSSCRVHANVNLAKRAAKELFCLDPQNSLPYVLLANIYNSLGRWDEAAAVRELMSSKQVLKYPGSSWIEEKS